MFFLVLYSRALQQSSVLPRLAMTRALGDHMLKMPAGDLDQSTWNKHRIRSFARLWPMLIWDVDNWRTARCCPMMWSAMCRTSPPRMSRSRIDERCAKLPWHGIRFRYREQDLGSDPREIPQITHQLYVCVYYYYVYTSNDMIKISQVHSTVFCITVCMLYTFFPAATPFPCFSSRRALVLKQPDGFIAVKDHD